jgi:hypothetical protein
MGSARRANAQAGQSLTNAARSRHQGAGTGLRALALLSAPLSDLLVRRFRFCIVPEE